MHSVAGLLRTKGNVVYTTTPETTALAAARQMNEHRIGALVVIDGPRLAGIVTERDMLTRIVAGERAPATTRVEHIMTRGVLTCSPETHIGELRALMREKRIRHIPVLDHGSLVGMVSIGDLNAAEAQNLSETIGFLEHYIAS